MLILLKLLNDGWLVRYSIEQARRRRGGCSDGPCGLKARSGRLLSALIQGSLLIEEGVFGELISQEESVI